MIGLGTLINTGAVLAGGLIGMVCKRGLRQNLQDILMQASGVAVIFIGIAGTLQRMFTVSGGALETQGTMLLIFSLVLGSLLGCLIDVERRMEQAGDGLRKLLRRKNDSGFVDGFVNTTLIICIGAMAIVGSIQDGLTGDHSLLAAKAVLDLVIVVVMTSTYGLGAACSALPIFVYQGTITLVAHFCGAFIGDELISQLSLVGSALIFCVGVNVAFGKKFPVGNMLPSLLIPIVWDLLPL